MRIVLVENSHACNNRVSRNKTRTAIRHQEGHLCRTETVFSLRYVNSRHSVSHHLTRTWSNSVAEVRADFAIQSCRTCTLVVLFAENSIDIIGNGSFVDKHKLLHYLHNFFPREMQSIFQLDSYPHFSCASRKRYVCAFFSSRSALVSFHSAIYLYVGVQSKYCY